MKVKKITNLTPKKQKVEGTVIYADTDSIAENSIIYMTNGSEKTIKTIFNEEFENDFNNYKINYDGREFIFPKKLNLPYYDEDKHIIKNGKVQYIEKHLVKKPIFRIKTNSGRYIDVTEDHSCMILDIYGVLSEVKPKDIKKDDKCVSINDVTNSFYIDFIESVDFLNNDEQYVYDIGMVDTPHTFFANGILVHNSCYIDFGKILKSMDYDYENKDQEIVKNYIIYNEEKTNDELGIHLDMSDEEIGKFSKIEEEADSLQNHVSNLINNTMKRLMILHFNATHNRISFKREAVASRGIFIEKKRYVLWAINNEGVELPEKKRLKVTGIDIIRSNTPKFVKRELKDVIIKILKNVDYDETISQLREIHNRFWEASPSEIAFMKSANGINKWSNKRKEEGKFKSTPQHVRGSILYNDYIDANPSLKNKYDKIYDGDKVCILYTKKGPHWDADVFVFKDIWVDQGIFEEYIDRRRQFEVSMVSPVQKFFNALNWQLPDFENNDMSDLCEW